MYKKSESFKSMYLKPASFELQPFKSKPVQSTCFKVGLLVLSTFVLAACSPKDSTTASNHNTADVPLISSKTQAVAGAQSRFCDEDGCTTYDLQSVDTNQAWINSYFLDRIKTAEPNAFTAQPEGVSASQVQSTQAASQAQAQSDTDNRLSESMMKVRYLGQNQALASFQLQSYSYAAGAAHGLSHSEYVNFDLKNKKRIAVEQLLKPDVEAKLLKALYENNQTWLSEHQIKASELKLSDNYYYGVHGLVFVYPLYELASYAEGMPELILPYDQAQAFVRPEYLPN